MPQANDKFEEATRKKAKAKYFQIVRQVLHQCSVSYQPHCWYNKLTKAGEIGHGYKDDEDPHNAWGFPKKSITLRLYRIKSNKQEA